jgi:hypothetical protein
MTENVSRTLNNFAKVPSWNTTLSSVEVEELFEATGGTVFCYGMLRQIVTEIITNNLFKVYIKQI